MSRSIITADDLGRGGAAMEAGTDRMPGADEYQDRLVKYLPAEVLTLFVVADTAVRNAPDDFPRTIVLWVAFLVCLVGTPLYLHLVSGVQKHQQLAVSTLGFAVWVFAIGGPFDDLVPHRAVYATLLLPLFTFAVPLFEAKR